MVIETRYKRFDIKETAITKLERLVDSMCRTLRTDNIWLDKPVGTIMCINNKHGYFTFTNKEGKVFFPRNAKGYEIMEMISAVRERKIFSYIESDGKHLKIKPKNKI